jgi:LL-diaminopimelate aminotransferase
MKGSTRLASLGSYAFAEVDNLVASLRSQGIEPIDFGVGDPVDPTPSLVRSACKAGVDERAAAGYPSYVGVSEYRDAVAAWAQRRFGLSLDPATEITSTIGAKEAVFHLPLAFVNPGSTPSRQIRIIPLTREERFSRGGTRIFPPFDEERGYQADLSAIPDDVLARTRILWLNYPSNPPGRLPPRRCTRRRWNLAVDHDIILVSDECYSEMKLRRCPAFGSRVWV